uniref:Uncharacterized protein n=1 Tax=Arundo donax TaxID=35708 RepID=A0A0A9GW25_ARUDO
MEREDSRAGRIEDGGLAPASSQEQGRKISRSEMRM